MMEVVGTDARRTKNSIIFYIILTAALSSIFHVLVIHRSGGGRSRGSLILGLSIACFTAMVLGISFLFTWMRLRSGSVWTGILLHASHNLFVQAFFDAQTRRARVIELWTTEFGAGLAIAALVVVAIFYAKRDELPAQHLAESALQNSSITAAVG